MTYKSKYANTIVRERERERETTFTTVSISPAHTIIILSLVAGEDPHLNTSVRLVDTSGSNLTAEYEGRVEIQYRGLWGTICNLQWTINDAHVICRSVIQN